MFYHGSGLLKTTFLSFFSAEKSVKVLLAHHYKILIESLHKYFFQNYRVPSHLKTLKNCTEFLIFFFIFHVFRSSHQSSSTKKGVLKNFAKFTR